MATISVLGLYNWDPTLFDEMVMPEYTDKPTDTYRLPDSQRHPAHSTFHLIVAG